VVMDCFQKEGVEGIVYYVAIGMDWQYRSLRATLALIGQINN
jgi:hypothetical protein